MNVPVAARWVLMTRRRSKGDMPFNYEEAIFPQKSAMMSRSTTNGTDGQIQLDDGAAGSCTELSVESPKSPRKEFFERSRRDYGRIQPLWMNRWV